MEGWIKMHRQILENPLASKPNYLAIWIYLLLKANHEDKEIIWNNKKTLIKKGSFITSKQSIAKHFDLSVGTVSYILDYFKVEQMIEQLSNHRFTVISIHNYSQFQGVEQSVENKLKTNRTQVETNKNDKNDKNLLTNVSKGGNPEIELLLKTYKDTFGHSPTDKYPRRVAQNLRQVINSLVKDLNKDRPDLGFKEIVERTFKWYDKTYDFKGDTLDVVKRKARILFDSTRTKYGIEVKK